MKQWGYFKKTVIICLIVTVIAFLISIPLYPIGGFKFLGESLTIREVIWILSVIIGLLSGIAFMIMVIPKRFRQKSFIPFSMGICSLIVIFIFISDGFHFVKDINKSVVRTCKKYYRQNKGDVFISDITEWTVTPVDSLLYSCEVKGTINESGLSGSARFIVKNYNSKWNLTKVYETVGLLKPQVNNSLQSIFQRAGCNMDSYYREKGDDLFRFIREKVARYIGVHGLNLELEKCWSDSEGRVNAIVTIRPSLEVHNLKILLVDGEMYNDDFVPLKRIGVFKFNGNFSEGKMYELNILSDSVNSTFNITQCDALVVDEDILSDDWIINFLLNDEYYLSAEFWEWYNNDLMREFLQFDRDNFLIRQLILEHIDMLKRIDDRNDYIINDFIELYSLVKAHFYIEQFDNSSEYALPKFDNLSNSDLKEKLYTETTVLSDHEFVDLGLSVKWATCNVGASSPSAYGDYYAWGETSTKSSYTLENYRFRISGDSYENVKLSKYNYESDRGTVDNRTVLEMSDDVARQKWGGSWRIPTKEEFMELIDNCDWTWTTINGVTGYKVTSKKSGYSSHSIFLPATGYRGDTSLHNTGVWGCYWSSSHTSYNPYDSWELGFDSNSRYTGTMGREFGIPVRPVFDNKTVTTDNSSPSNTTVVTNTNEAPQFGYVNVDCPLCNHSGECSTCNGKGWYYSPYGTGTIDCPNCDRNHNGKCNMCHGTGQVQRYERLN